MKHQVHCAVNDPISSPCDCMPKEKTYYFEYYNSHPNIRFGFEITAETSEEAERKANQTILSLRRVAFHESKYR